MLTMFAYRTISASMTHTLKASSPLFAAGIAALLDQKYPTFPVTCSLVAISIGVVGATVTEVEFSVIGFILALLSCLVHVLLSRQLKRTITHPSIAHPIQLHILVSGLSSAIMFPAVMYFAVRRLFHWMDSPSDLPEPVLESSDRSILFPLTSEHLWIALGIAVSLILNWCASLCSFMLLSKISFVSHQVANSAKRLVVIIASSVWLHRQLSISNSLCVIVTISACCAYSLFTRGEPSKAPRKVSIGALL